MAAEPATGSTAADPPPPGGKPKGKQKTIAGIPAPVAIAGIIAFVVAGGYFLLHRQAASSAASGTGDGTAGGANASPDDSAALSDIEQQLSDLNGMIGQGGGGLGGSDGGGGTTGTTGDGTGDGTGTGTGTGGPPPTTPNPLNKLHWITVGGKGATRDLYQIARDNGITEAQLLKLNPQLKKYEGTKKPLPNRVRILV